MRVHTLVQRVADQEYEVRSGVGYSDLDAAVALDVEVQSMRSASQLNYLRVREAAREEEEEETAVEVTIGGPGEESN